MVALPAATPVTTPAALTLAIDVLLLVHAPPLTASVNVDVAPAQMVDAPVTVPADGNGLTVIAFVALTVPQLLVTE